MVNCAATRLGLSIIFLSLLLFAQTELIEKNIQFINQNNPILKEANPENLSFFINETSGIKLSALWYIRFYQNFISTQHDNQRMCTFIPSCSRFSVEAIKYYGVIKGILLTSDRLQRCNNFGNSNYIINKQTGKRVDLIKKYGKSEN